MAAPDLRLRTPNGTGANRSTEECEWKQGESAGGKQKPFLKRKELGRACSASRWSAIGGRERAEERFYLTRSGPLMEAATVRRCEKIDVLLRGPTSRNL